MIIFQPPVDHPWTPYKVVLLSGLSDPSSCALSGIQQRFLEQLAAPPGHAINANFPYFPPGRPVQAHVPILLASWRNLMQYRRARSDPYREHARRHWNALTHSCNGLFVVTLSSGLEILNVCLGSDPQPIEIEVLALGPVARRRPPVPHLLVRGSRDLVMNPWFREVDHIMSGVGHLDYLRRPSVIELAKTRLEALTTRLRDRQELLRSLDDDG